MSKGKVKIWSDARELTETGTIFVLNIVDTDKTITFKISASFNSDLHNLLDGMLRDKLYNLDITEESNDR